MRKFLALLLLVPCLSWGNEKYLDPEYSFRPDSKIVWAEDTGALSKTYEVTDLTPNTPHSHSWTKDIVRDGEYAIRLETRGLECYGFDCTRGDYKGMYGRTEFGFWNRQQTGENWFRWSVFIPEETNHIRPAYTMFTQFKTSSKIKGKNGCPLIPLHFMLDNKGIELTQEIGDCEYNSQIIIPNNENFKEKWLDFVMHSKWSNKDDGFLHLWVNGKRVWSHTGPNLLVVSNQYPPIMRFPIYNGKRDKNYTGSQVFYYDAFYSAKKCEDMKLETLGYSCKDLISKLNVPIQINLEELDKEKEDKADCEPGRKLVYKEGTNIPKWIEVVCD